MTPPRPLSPEEEARIQAQIAEDADDEDLTDAQLAEARPFAEVFADSIRRSVGRPRLDNARQPVTLRLTPATLAKFERLGPDWRARMARILEEAEV